MRLATNNKSSLPVRPIDIIFGKYNASHQKPINRWINYVTMPLVAFGILELSWAIPFPHLGFLGRYNGYINWASLVIALSIYFYQRISPILSYIMLFILFAYSYGIIKLDEWHKTGGPDVAIVCLVLLLVSFTAQFIGQTIEGKRYSFLNSVKFFFYGPIWLLSLVLTKFSIKY